MSDNDSIVPKEQQRGEQMEGEVEVMGSSDLPQDQERFDVIGMRPDKVEVSEDEMDVLEREFSYSEIQEHPMKSTGDGKPALYVPWATLAKRLHEAFGPGQWSLIPYEQPHYSEQDKEILWPGALFIRGNLISTSVGSIKWYPDSNMTRGDALEASKSNCLHRNCKGFMPAILDLWDPEFIEGYWRNKAESEGISTQNIGTLDGLQVKQLVEGIEDYEFLKKLFRAEKSGKAREMVMSAIRTQGQKVKDELEESESDSQDESPNEEEQAVDDPDINATDQAFELMIQYQVPESEVEGTGDDGMITAEDVNRFIEEQGEDDDPEPESDSEDGESTEQDDSELDDVHASGKAIQLMEEYNVSEEDVNGTGKNGRILKSDVQDYIHEREQELKSPDSSQDVDNGNLLEQQQG